MDLSEAAFLPRVDSCKPGAPRCRLCTGCLDRGLVIDIRRRSPHLRMSDMDSSHQNYDGVLVGLLGAILYLLDFCCLLSCSVISSNSVYVVCYGSLLLHAVMIVW